ncbi:hypothetical protein DXG01_006917 [Tephrocybe rancida]|nr:hypothetical protein DXG01_006917 [Tephrocybe rancida]
MLRRGCYFMISVVLDDGAYVDFSGIRILILENSSLDIRLSEVDLEDHVSFRRTALQRKLRLPQLVLDKSRSPTQNAKPLCTVAFYLHPGTDGPPYYGTILLEPVPDLVYASANTPRKVVYDSIYPCNAGSHSMTTPQQFSDLHYASGFFQLLETDPERALSCLELFCVKYFERHSGVADGGAICSRLDWSAKIGRTYLTFSLDGTVAPWRGETLWRHERRPVSGDDISSTVTDERVMEALVDILQLAPLVQAVNLGNLRTPLRADVMGTLAMLKEVETASVSSAASFFDDKPTPPFAMKDIQALVANWTKLRHLTIKCWKDEDEATSLPPNVFGENSDINLRPEHPHFILQTLTIQSGHLNGTQLRWFTLVPNVGLKEIILTSVKGLSNSDLFHFLSVISATIVKVSITKCPIARNSATETPAFDAVLPQMMVLEEASLEGEIVSAATIAQDYSPRPNGAKTRLTIRNRLLQDDVIQALETCCWNVVFLEVLWSEDRGFQPRAFDTAGRRGIVIDIERTRSNSSFA